MKKIIIFKPTGNEPQIKQALKIVFKGHCTVYDFIDKENVCFMFADIDEGIVDDLQNIGLVVKNAPELK